MKLKEGKIEFDFDDKIWKKVIKYDESTDFKKIEKLNGTKAVDFAGLCNSDMVFIEVKNYRGVRIEKKEILKTGEIEDEIATKVKDTIAGIVGAARNSTHQKHLFSEYLSSIINSKNQVKMVFWIEEDLNTMTNTTFKKRIKARKNNHIKLLRTRLNWLTQKIFVADKQNNPFGGSLTINFLSD